MLCFQTHVCTKRVVKWFGHFGSSSSSSSSRRVLVVVVVVVGAAAAAAAVVVVVEIFQLKIFLALVEITIAIGTTIIFTAVMLKLQ